MKYYKLVDEPRYYKVYDNNSWQYFNMPKSTDKNNNVIIEWNNGGINFYSRAEDNGWEIEEVTETQIKAAIFVLAL